MQLTNEQQRLLRGMFPDEDGILREDVEQAIEEFLTAQTSSYRAAIEKMKYKRGFFEIDPQPSSHLGYYNRAIDQVLNLFTEGKV